MPVRVAGRSDDVPGAGAEGAEGAEGHGLRIEVQLLLLDGLLVAPLLGVTVLVGSVRPLRCRLITSTLLVLLLQYDSVNNGALCDSLPHM